MPAARRPGEEREKMRTPHRTSCVAGSREDEENIAASLTKCVVAREGIDRSAGYHGSGYTDGSSVSGNAVDCLELVAGVVIPQYLSVRSGISAQMTIERAGEHHAGNGSDCGGLGWTARLAFIARRGRSGPQLFTGVQRESEKSAYFFGIETGRAPGQE